MSSIHHPHDETLARHAAGSLGPAASLVVETHLAHCSTCRAALGDFEAVGGALFECLPPASPPADGLSRALAAIERGSSSASASKAPATRASRPPLPEGFALPASLDHCDFGRWRWLAPGIKVSSALSPWAKAEGLKLLRIEPGKKLLRHGHQGAEWTCILSGTFSDERARFVKGDFAEVDEDVDHQPVVDGDEECICLVAQEGRMRPHGIVGRLYQMVFDA
jgi:putative transcriptional regulator